MDKKWFDFLWILAVIGALALSAQLKSRDFERNQVVQGDSKPSYLIRADIDQ